MKYLILALLLCGCNPSHEPAALKRYDEKIAKCKTDCAPRESNPHWNGWYDTYICECKP